MKITAIAAAWLCLTVTTTPAYAGDNVDANDPCTVFFCMAGKLYGSSPGECQGAVKTFFSLNAFKKKHRFNPGKTLDMRKAFLGQCASADPVHVSGILSRFGRIPG